MTIGRTRGRQPHAGGVVAGIDVGNSTTEVVLGRPRTDGTVALVAAGRTPTRRGKGSPESMDAAAALVRRLERQHGVRVEGAVVAPLRPVETRTTTLPEERRPTGRLQVSAARAGTAGGSGTGVGRPFRLDRGGADPAGGDALVALVPPGTGYLAAVDALVPLARAGRLAGVVMADDEAVLVANRLPARVPVVDEVPPAGLEVAQRAELLAVEVTTDGHPLRTLTDPLRLSELLGLEESDLPHAATVAALLADATNGIVARGAPAPVPATTSTAAHGWVELDGAGRLPIAEALSRLPVSRVGAAQRLALPPELSVVDVDDLWAVDLGVVATQVQARRSGPRPVSLAWLRRDAPAIDPADAIGERLGLAVHTVSSEAAMARAGALSTPGSTADTLVVDLGGGTVDTVSSGAAVVAAGGGELLTQSVAALAGTTAAAAEHVKRGPAHRVDAPQLLLAEDGTRAFLDRPAPTDTVGALVVRGPAGLLPFHRTLAPGEWRALRLRLKVDLLGGNVARAMRTLEVAPRAVVVVGGPAADDEVLTAVAGAMPPGTAVGRGDVGGLLGPRYSVAWGLLASAP